MLPRQSGSIVNISSIRGFSPNPGRMTYCAPKAAVIMTTSVAAGEWAEHGVPRERDRARCPPYPHVGCRCRSRGDRRAVLHRHRSGRRASGCPRRSEQKLVGLPLLANDASYITGSVHTIDGALMSIPAAYPAALGMFLPLVDAFADDEVTGLFSRHPSFVRGSRWSARSPTRKERSGSFPPRLQLQSAPARRRIGVDLPLLRERTVVVGYPDPAVLEADRPVLS